MQWGRGTRVYSGPRQLGSTRLCPSPILRMGPLPERGGSMSVSGIFVPTGRAIALLVGTALLALVIAARASGAWTIAPVLGLLVLALVAVDALLAGGNQRVQLTTPGDVEVGEDQLFHVVGRIRPRPAPPGRMALAADPRLLPGGKAEQALVRGDDGLWHADIPYRPTRRGTGAVERLWLRWTGPLGLGARQAWHEVGQACGSGRMWRRCARPRCKPICATPSTG